MQKIYVTIFIAGVMAGIVTDRLILSGSAAVKAEQDRQRSEEVARQADEQNKLIWGGALGSKEE